MNVNWRKKKNEENISGKALILSKFSEILRRKKRSKKGAPP